MLHKKVNILILLTPENACVIPMQKAGYQTMAVCPRGTERAVILPQ